MDVILSVVDLIVLAAYLFAIPACLIKGRPLFALFGLVMFATGAVVSFSILRQVREGLLEDWVWWALAVQGVAVAAVLVWAAMLPARPGSRWDERAKRSASISPR